MARLIAFTTWPNRCVRRWTVDVCGRQATAGSKPPGPVITEGRNELINGETVLTMRLLVFDDDAAIGRLVVRLAVLAGLKAEAVTDAAAFERSLAAAPPEIIVLDLQLGGTDGVEQLRFLAARRYTGSIIVMSGFDPRVLEATSTVARNLGLNIVAAPAEADPGHFVGTNPGTAAIHSAAAFRRRAVGGDPKQ
jgi:CheY-like chemotaxis protein